MLMCTLPHNYHIIIHTQYSYTHTFPHIPHIYTPTAQKAHIMPPSSQVTAMDSRMLSGILTGVRRAFPYVQPEDVEPLVEVCFCCFCDFYCLSCACVYMVVCVYLYMCIGCACMCMLCSSPFLLTNPPPHTHTPLHNTHTPTQHTPLQHTGTCRHIVSYCTWTQSLRVCSIIIIVAHPY